MSSVPPEKRCSTFLRFATSDTASATPEDHGPTTNLAPSASTASSVRRVEVPACVPPSRVMYLIGLPRIFMSRSSRAILMPRSLSGPTSAKAPVWSHRPRITISFDWARRIAGKPRPVATSAPIFSTSLRLIWFMLVSLSSMNCGSFHLGARGDDDLGPLRRLGGDDPAEVGRRARDRPASELGQARLYLGIGEGPVRFGVELRDDLRGRALGHADAEPRGGFVARHGFTDGRHARQGRLALRRRDRERADAPALDVAGGGRQVVKEHVDRACDKLDERRTGALERHVQHVAAGHGLEQLA